MLKKLTFRQGACLGSIPGATLAFKQYIMKRCVSLTLTKDLAFGSVNLLAKLMGHC